jgi:hypothetical protein
MGYISNRFGILEELALPFLGTLIVSFLLDDFFILSSSCCWRFLSFNSHSFASIVRVTQISGGTCANLHIIAVFNDAAMSISSSEPVEA